MSEVIALSASEVQRSRLAAQLSLRIIDGRNWLRYSGAAAGLAGTLALAACGGGSGNESSTAASSSSVGSSSTPNTPSASSTGAFPRLIFDDLGGGSPDVRTFRGPGTSEADRMDSGKTYNGHGSDSEKDTIDILCYDASGRTVSSDTTVGEQARTSTLWFRKASVTQEWATAVYAENAQQVQAESRQCTDAEIPHY